MKQVIYFLICIFLTLNINSQTNSHENKSTKLENPITEAYIIKHLSTESPKLILTPAIELQLKQKLKTDPTLQHYYGFLKEESERILTLPLIKHELLGFRMGAGREATRRFGTLCMVYRIDKNPKILSRINSELLAICAFEDWNHQHYLDTAQLSFGVALAIDWTGFALPKETIALAKKALIEKGILPSYNENGVRMGWVNGTNNWNTVCHGGMIAASLAIADVDPALAAKTISRALDKLPNSLEGYAPDGVYPEGPFYWRFGTSFAVLASNVLTTALGSDFGISNTPGFMETADYRLQVTAPSGECFNYADSDGKTDGEAAAVLAWFAAKTGNGNYINKQFFENPRDESLRLEGEDALIPQDEGRLAGVSLVWLSQCNYKKETEIPLEWLGKSKNPLAIFRGGKEDKGNFYLAVKGGTALISHGNMDAGTFILELNNVRWVVDPGNQSYYLLNKINFDLANSKQDGARWSLLTKNNFGHSTITVNDELFKVIGNAAIIDFKKGEKPEVTIDMSSVYGDNLNSSTRRFVKESNKSVLIEDHFEINKNTKYITWQLITVADVIPVKNGAILKQDGKELKLDILSPEDLNVSIVSLFPAPLEIDKQIKNLKRIEIRVPANVIQESKGLLKVRLSAQ